MGAEQQMLLGPVSVELFMQLSRLRTTLSRAASRCIFLIIVTNYPHASDHMSDFNKLTRCLYAINSDKVVPLLFNPWQPTCTEDTKTQRSFKILGHPLNLPNHHFIAHTKSIQDQ